LWLPLYFFLWTLILTDNFNFGQLTAKYLASLQNTDFPLQLTLAYSTLAEEHCIALLLTPLIIVMSAHQPDMFSQPTVHIKACLDYIGYVAVSWIGT